MDKDKLNTLLNDTGTVLVEFYATWCPHCRRMAPVVDDLKMLLEGRATVYQFDIDRNGGLADELGAKSVPTFIVYRNGREMWRQSGEMEAATLVSTAEKYLSGDN